MTHTSIFYLCMTILYLCSCLGSYILFFSDENQFSAGKFELRALLGKVRINKTRSVAGAACSFPAAQP